VAANENQAELIIQDHRVIDDARRIPIAPLLERRANASFAILSESLAPQDVEGPMLRYLHEPRGRIIGDAIAGPPAERREQRFLHYVLDQLDMTGAEDTRERCRHPGGFVTKEVVDEGGD
jgi:hypothetical protein